MLSHLVPLRRAAAHRLVLPLLACSCAVEQADPRDSSVLVRHELRRHGLSFELPAHYRAFSLEGTELDRTDTVAFQSSSNPGGDVSIVLRFFSAGPLPLELAIASGERELLADFPAAAAEDTRGPLGEGRFLTIASEERRQEIELFPLGSDRVLRIHVFGHPAALRAAAVEVQRFRLSLEATAE